MKVKVKVDKVRNADASQIYEMLKESIISHKLLPNQKLVELELSRRFNVSRTPLREALRRLEAEGFVTYSKNRGVYVSYLSPEEVVERFIYFSNLLAFASSLSVEHLTRRQIDELNDYDNKMRSATSHGERIQWVAYNQSFHITLLSACPNKYLLSQLTKEGERLWRYWAGAFNLVFDLDEYHREHSEIIKMALQKDSAGIYDIMFVHTSRFSEKIKIISGKLIPV